MQGFSSKGTLAFVFVALGTVAASAAPTTGAAASGVAPGSVGAPVKAVPISALKEIGRVRARTAFCQAVYDHGGLATSVALSNDASLAATSDYLSHADLDENAMAKPRAIYDMQRSYEALMGRAHDAIDETKALRKLADDAPTAAQKAALVAYADAVGGALHRQEIVAKEYRQFGVYLEAHEPVSWQQHNFDLSMAAATEPRPEQMATDPRDRVTPLLADLSKLEAVHITDIHGKVLDDEARAATQVDAAFGPCAPDAAP